MLTQEEFNKVEKRIRNASYIGIFLAIITTIAAVVGTINDNVRIIKGYDFWLIFDVIIILGLSYGISQRNRFAALALLLYYTIFKVIDIVAAGKVTSIFFVILIIYYLYQGTIAAFKLHSHLVETGEKTKIKLRGVTILIITILGGAGSAIFFYLIYLGTIGPETEVIPGKYIKTEYKEFLLENDLLEEDEQILYWYSGGITNFKETFNVLTDKHIIDYNEELEEPATIILIDSITGVYHSKGELLIDDNIISVYFMTDSFEMYLEIPLSNDYGTDTLYYNKLKDLYEEKSPYFNNQNILELIEEPVKEKD